MLDLLQIQVIFLVGVHVINCRPIDRDPCDHNEALTPHTCKNVTCYHGNCVNKLVMVNGQLNVDGQCVCEPGWSGIQCDICEEKTSTEAMPISSGIDFCSGLPVVDVKPTHCHGLTCVHGRCVNVSRDDMEAYMCQCDEGWAGIHCERCCDITCNYGKCQVDYQTGDRYCVCDNSSLTESSNCTETLNVLLAEDSPSPWVLGVVGSGVLVVIIFVSVIVILPYWMWKNRHLLVMRIVYFFQKYDDSERRFHVFISYRSSTDDEKFVVEKLHPKLEDMKLRVCVHYRDFIPGTSIAENILDAVENSSRTIIVLSPDYCSGTWPRFEVLAAQREMLRMRHRIVPIVFKDISEEKASGQVDVLLQYIIDSVTYLKWPSDGDEKAEQRFWKLLKLSMPKLRDDG